MVNQSDIGTILAATFTEARIATPGLAESWVGTSHRVGGLLVHSKISATVQRLGEIDAVCRCIERELNKPATEVDMRFHYYVMMAEIWVGIAYSVCYILDHRKLATDDNFKRLTEDLRLVRVQLEKYEIPSDRKLGVPIEMTTGPSGPDGSVPSISIYDYNDNRRAHIGRSGLSARKSLMWEVIEVNPVGHRWLERTDLSDRFLQIFS